MFRIAEINDHLYLCGATALKANRVKSLGVTAIINCTMEIQNMKVPTIEFMQINLPDLPGSNLGAHFDKAADKIHKVHQNGGKTLVHCVAGISRSASICIAYLVKYQGMALDKAYHHIKGCRPIIHPNVGFWRQLIQFEKRITGKNTVAMISSGVGPIPDVYKQMVKNMIGY